MVKKKKFWMGFPISSKEEGQEAWNRGCQFSCVAPHSAQQKKKSLFLFHLMHQSHCNQIMVTSQLELNMTGSKCNRRSRTES